MATENLEYLDESGLNRTAGNVLAKIAESKAQIEEELNSLSYAKPDGIYPDMTVGAVIGADETSQWSQRVTEGSGSATVRSVQGAAVAWNQLNNNSGTTNSTGLTRTNNADGSVTMSGTAQAGSTYLVANFGAVANHIYLLKGAPQGSSASTYYLRAAGSTQDYGNGAIFNVGNTPPNPARIIFSVAEAIAGSEIDVTFWAQLFDLTAMFGSGNEPQTVAEFERMYPEAYYPYSAPVLKPVQIAGIQSKDAQGGELDAIEWTAQTLWGAGTASDVLYADHIERRMGLVDLGSLAWGKNSGVDNQFYATLPQVPVANSTNAVCTELIASARGAYDRQVDGSFSLTGPRVRVYDSRYTITAEFKTAMNGVMLAYELATPTISPISPALPMTYRVQQGGSESIIVHEGEISAAPIITIAEPVNMSTELAQIWAAIEALQASRQALQSDVRSDVQEITAELTPIDVTKEVQQTDEDREVSE